MELNAILNLINLLFTEDVYAMVRYDYDLNPYPGGKANFVVLKKTETPHTGM